MDREAARKLAAARLILRAGTPYFMTTIYGLVPHATEEVETMAVTHHMVLLYNEPWVADKNTTIEELAGALLHEGLHVLMRHLDRIPKGADLGLLNIAQDLAINPQVVACGYKLPDGVLYPKAYGFPEGLTTEAYYALLLQLPKSKRPTGKQKPGCGNCGGIGGPPTPNEERIDREMGRSPVEQKRIVEQTFQEAREYKKTGPNAGNVPGWMLQEIEVDISAKIRWQDKMASLVHRLTGQVQVGGDEASFRRPSKRSHARGVIRPGCVEQLPEILVVLDTSASMQHEQLKAVVAETAGIITSTGVDEVWLMQADVTVACAPVRVRVSDLKKITIHGRGGTNFDDALRRSETLRPMPDVLVYLTDGGGSASYRPRGIEVIWGRIAAPLACLPDAPFGHLVEIPA